MHRFSGMKCVVTGGTRGIGEAIGRRLVSEGATVVVTGRTEESALSTAQALSEEGPGKAYGLGFDMGSVEEVSAAAPRIEELLGEVDVLVNNAGIATLHRFLDVPVADLDDVLAVNVRGPFLLSQHIAGGMAGRGGAVINISSQAGHQGQALVSHYATSKAALIGLTKCMALELAPHVRVNAVCPGIIETEMIERDFSRQAELLGVTADDVRQRTLAAIPLGRFQEASAVADAVAFLASPEATEITGQIIHVNGGMTTS
ncbi:3-oxoacyl-[acyl-carrier-protein] reductase [Streptomyces virens]|uniref:3-oxoacyl-ACP reductase n=2 Tax=Streptomyces TaxID=1883 RepID=A0A514JLB7_9ACTN|nr:MULTISPECIES: glucose 1-dehydrogenase [Streptomyces]MBA8942247.1 NAD(P)-dependent dehydrogenase (short-subunit alcohol dehydrogenase family) [Streptomyces calvus]MBA8975816.1 NAD(P)-dependent dehydrogenase (short-subunit alcohol dehydrogenase family) [Streptomyces calvus]MYS30282.1 glucose 1-dehydrogenase [Streptomyces sp. SID7804]QDI68109.1 3-oxoacyl-ACP reductase [Streptomyces calvus]GGP51697.1 3-oxoacyl-[acyl-carrier-protein] reductase FabG [Streptomyces calvus]